MAHLSLSNFFRRAPALIQGMEKLPARRAGFRLVITRVWPAAILCASLPLAWIANERSKNAGAQSWALNHGPPDWNRALQGLGFRIIGQDTDDARTLSYAFPNDSDEKTHPILWCPLARILILPDGERFWSDAPSLRPLESGKTPLCESLSQGWLAYENIMNLAAPPRPPSLHAPQKKTKIWRDPREFRYSSIDRRAKTRLNQNP